MKVSPQTQNHRRPFLLAVLLAASPWMSACAPLLVGGAMVGGAMVVTDRRTSGAQLEDQSIEFKSGNRLREVLGDRGRVSPTSYNRLVLLTGEVASEADKTAAEQAVARVENVRATVNELTVLGSGAFASSLANRSNDLILSGKVKATFVDAKDVHANAFKVVTDRGVVYLMGRVTEREADRATELARSINGVQKVVRVFEIISEAELANMRPAADKK
ncbi:MAG: BON domain-containing protein [Burkholderiales bacterium]